MTTTVVIFSYATSCYTTLEFLREETPAMLSFFRSSFSAFAAFFFISVFASMCGPTVVAAPTHAPAAAPHRNFAEIRERAVDTTVRIGAQKQMIESGAVSHREVVGTGVVIAAGPLVLTANHLVRDATDVTIRFPLRSDGPTIPMHVVRRSEDKDVALLAPKDRTITITALPIARRIPSPGDAIWFYGRTSSMSSGTVLDDAAIIEPRGRLIETDAISTNGDSGAPCMNDRGELVGILILGNGGPHAYFVRIDDALAALGVTPKN